MGLGKKMHKAFKKMGNKVSNTVQKVGSKIDHGIDVVAKGTGKLTNVMVKGTGIASRILDAANSAGLGAVTGGLSTSAGEAMKRAHQGAVKIDDMRDKYADKLKDKRANAFANANNKIAQGLGKVEGKVMGQVGKVNEIGSSVKKQYELEKNNLRKKTDALNAETENFA